MEQFYIVHEYRKNVSSTQTQIVYRHLYVQSRNVKFLAVRKIAKLTNLRIILFYYSFFGDVIINCEIANERARRKVSNNMSKLWSK